MNSFDSDLIALTQAASTAKRLRRQQRFNRAALVHCAVSLRYLVERQPKVEYSAWVNLPVQYQLDHLGQVAAHRSRSTVQMHVGEKQLLTVEFDAVRNANVTYVTARARRSNGLHHRLLGADAFQHRVSADSVGQLLDSRNTFITSLSDNVGRTKFACELLARRVTAHRDDPFSTHLFSGEHT